ncbi:MAG: chromosome segregation protein SMC [bacterium]
MSDLEIVGFKSFAQKINFKFADGITGLVGPNGCGKTNIVDAIRWVLGEQKSSILRSDIMEDVIFNGTSRRKPLGMAEVSLTLQNTKQILPTEYTEVTIARRLFRNGESQYLLNNTQCRLRDVMDLFMDTGIGADSYSVIELKMVEAILSGKPEERRSLVEEAAGVKKYKLRRKEAARKLLNIQSDLLRVKDIVTEIEKQVNSLSRQAAKTRRFNKLTEELKSYEVNLLFHQWENYKSILGSISGQFEELKQKKSEKSKEIQSDEKALNELKDKMALLDTEYQSALEQENAINSQISKVTQDSAVTKERITALNSSNIRIQAELAEYSETYSNLNEQIESIKKSLNNVIELVKQVEIEFKTASESREEVRKLVNEARDQNSYSNEEVLSFQNRIQSILNELEHSKNRKASLERSIEESFIEINTLKSNLKKLEEEISLKKEKNAEFDQRVSDVEIALKTAEEHKKTLETEIEKQRENLSGLNIELGNKKASLEMLQSIIDTDESTKYLMKESGWEPDKEKLLLGEAVSVDEKYRVAVAAALGDYSKYFIVDNKAEAESAISRLKENNKGKASFICKNLIPSTNKPSEPTGISGVIGLISEVVRADEKIVSALRMLLGKTVLVENLEVAWYTMDKGLCETAVTIEGELVKNKAFLRGGSKLKTEGLQIGKKERVEKLNKEISEFIKKITKNESKLKDLKDEHDSIDLADLNQKLRNAQNDRNGHEQIIIQLGYQIQGIGQNIQVFERNNENFKEEISQIEDTAKNYKTELKELEENLKVAKEQQLLKSAELREMEQDLAAKEDELHKVEMKKVRYAQETISLQKEIDSLNSRIEELEHNEERRKAEIQKNNDDVGTYEELIKELALQLENLHESSIEIQNQREFAGNLIKSFKEQVTQYSGDINLKRKEYEQLFESIHQLDLKVSELTNKLENVKARANEGYEINLETGEIVLDESFSIDETKKQVNELKDKLIQLGNVNFMALEEYEEQNERLQFYNNQVNDLQDAEKNLLDTIDEINRNAQEKFRETFDKVNTSFQDLFKRLFGEDAQAELKLLEGDPLEADIEITAKPPGKKPRTIEGLSGGEKTLTAIALLFAIYLVKPSPFCILDEVDAPLDDANIGRFIALIRDFSTDTQFLIVTHNKKTMEESDSLYGITMEEEGVSKVVSVRLSQENNN